MITSLVETLLINRGIVTPEQREEFLAPNFEKGIHNPFLLQDMDVAVERILRAIETNEKIVIYTDYDCDGIPGGVLMYDFFTKVGFTNFTNYIPHRHREGYGLNNEAIEKFTKEDVKLIITVDLGITNSEEVLYAKTFGIDIVVTDHHLPHTEIKEDGSVVQILPEAFAVINAKRDGNIYPDNLICGAATAWKLVCALISKGKEKNIKSFVSIPTGWEKWLLDMVALSTATDMVPLTGENRVLLFYGLKVLQKSPRPGLGAILKNAGVMQGCITEEDLGFSLGPRINAASRMAEPLDAFKALATRDISSAKLAADYLETLNKTRKENVVTFMKKAYALADTRSDMSVIVVGDLEWSPGVLGLIASKLQEKYKKTVFVWGKGGESDDIKGSCRSDGYVHLVDLMSAAQESTFLHMGGHELAGGFSVSYTDIHNLEKNINDAYGKILHSEISKKDDFAVDATLSLGDVNTDTYKDIQKLAPFGVGNQKPLFLFNNLKIDSLKLFGATKNHLELTFKTEENKTVKAIAFFTSGTVLAKNGKDLELEAGMNVNLEAFLELSLFAGKKELRLRIHKILI